MNKALLGSCNGCLFPSFLPYLILLAVLLLAFQNRLRTWVFSRTANEGRRHLNEAWTILLFVPAAVYGGYFGAGFGGMTLAVLGLVIAAVYFAR